MKQKFSTAWKASKQPRKQRKYLANAPLHLKQKMMSVNLSKELRKKHNSRNIPVRKGDTVKIMRGKFKKKRGKVLEVNVKRSKVSVEGILVKKRDGSNASVFLRPSILQIVELNMDDKKRVKKAQSNVKAQTPEKEKEISKEKQEKSK